MKTVKAMPDGFEIEFTLPVDKKSAADLAAYSVESFIYKYHPVYGSPTVNTEKRSERCESIGRRHQSAPDYR